MPAVYASKTVTVAGTRVQLSATPIVVSELTIEAKSDNTGRIFVGGASMTSSNGFQIAPGDSVTLKEAALNLTDYYIDADVSGEGVIIRYA